MWYGTERVMQCQADHVYVIGSRYEGWACQTLPVVGIVLTGDDQSSSICQVRTTKRDKHDQSTEQITQTDSWLQRESIQPSQSELKKLHRERELGEVTLHVQ